MGNHIVCADLDIQGGLLSGRISFSEGLNILSGENGTLKTKALHAIKSGEVVSHDPSSPCRRQAISPKRNAQRRAFREIIEQSRRSNLKLESLITERNINDNAFEEYPALGDLFFVVYDDLCKDGGNQKEKMLSATEEFNSVIQRIFPNYELIANWNETSGAPNIELMKNGMTRVPVEGLSLGEQEILSLATNIYSSRDRYDVFLIDEPEVHLNWHLEERLFDFFDDFCSEFGRQMIVVTHSRIVFSSRFFKKTKFLYWNEHGRVEIGSDVSAEQRRRIAGDAIEIVQFGNLPKTTIFVEDTNHALVVEELSKALCSDIAISECGNKSNVRSLFRYSKLDGASTNSIFLEDGDNERSPFPNEDRFIHLDKYCIESYLLDFRIASSVLGTSEQDLKQLLLDKILMNRTKIFRKNKFFEFLLDQLSIDHLTSENLQKLDVSLFLESVLDEKGFDLRTYVRRYIECANSRSLLDDVFPGKLVDAIRNADPQETSQEH